MSKLKIISGLFSFLVLTFLFVNHVSAANTPDYMRTFKPRVSATPRVWFDPKPSSTPRVWFDPKPTPRVTGDPRPTGERSCQAKLDSVKNRSAVLLSNMQGMFSKFNSLLSSVDAYYTGTVVPSGKTLPNYRTLMNEIQNNKTQVADAFTIVKADVAALSCRDFSGTVRKFNSDAQSLKEKLVNYKASIQKLVKAIKNLSGRPGVTAKPSVRPSVKPSGTPRPRPSCVPRPACLNQNPPCKIGLVEGAVWCPVKPPGVTPSPAVN